MSNGGSTVHLESPRLILRAMQRPDVEQMERWRPFSDPLHTLWNIPRHSSLSRDLWFALHSSDPSTLWFAVERREDKSLIGSLSLREIVGRTSARLGISLGADYVDQGYGSEALGLFLPYYFLTLGFQRLVLDVAATNKRAMHVYQKLGFRQTGEHYRNIPEHVDLEFLQREEYRDLWPYFRRRMGRLQLLFYDMVLEGHEWSRRQIAVGMTATRA
ncbi:MAG: GNAT family N-acetyltransferase [Chloroflexi bacterium]|nr:GNAT family N-acetyltransferase [Chloroflexota bacterium]